VLKRVRDSMKKRLFFLVGLAPFKALALFVFLLLPSLGASIKGSESQLSIESFYTFLTEETDNKMLGFGWFKNGFALEDSNATCTFDSVFPVSGDVYLNGGSLYLDQDLIFRNMTTWQTSGNIYGNDYTVDISSSVTGLGNIAYGQTFESSRVNINSDLIVSGTVKFRGDCLFNGNGKRILLNDDGYLLVDSNATVTFKDVYVDGITEGKIYCLDDSSKIVLDDVRWIQDGDYSFTNGSLKIFNNVDFSGSYTFFYQSSQTSTIDTHSYWNVSQGLKLSMGKKNGDGDVQPIYFVDGTSVLNLENCCLSITSSGASLTRGLMVLDRGVEIEINSTSSTHGLILGDGTDVGNIDFCFHPGARVLFSKGHLAYENTDPRSLRSRSGEALLVRSADSVFYINDDVQLEGIALDTHPSSQMFLADGKNLSYVNCRILYPGVEFELGGSRYNNYTNLMSGDGDIFLRRGVLTPYTYVSGANNILHGNGDVSGKIILQDDSAELSLDINGVIIGDVDLNGGLITLDHDAIFSQDAQFTGSGIVDISGYAINFGLNDLELTNSINWQGNGGTISINSNASLSGTWTFDGACCLDGSGHTLEIKPGGKIVVSPGATLKLENLRLHL